MFGFLKRKKIENWEIQMLQSTLRGLSVDYEKYLIPLEQGLLKGIIPNASDIKNYTAFLYKSLVYEKFYDPKENGFKLSGIKVKDQISDRFVPVTLYFSGGVINGYSIDIEKVAKFKLNPAEISIDAVKRIASVQKDFEVISRFLTQEETDRIIPSDVYVIEINGKNYYCLRVLEDGDFVGIDTENNVYRINHTPFGVIFMERSELLSWLK